MSNPNPAFIIVPSPFGSYSGRRGSAPNITIPASLVTPGVTGFYVYESNGPANTNEPDPINISVGR
jgi:hypothetical protein